MDSYVKVLRYIMKYIYILTLLFFSFSAPAEIIEYRFTDTNAESKIISGATNLINPVGNVNIVVSGGLDRYVNLRIISSDNIDVYDSKSDLIGIHDRITTADGDYFGYVFSTPQLDDGLYRIEQTLLDYNSLVVKTIDTTVIIDTTPPASDPTITWVKYGWSFGSINDFGTGGASRALELRNINDDNGLANAIYYAIDGNGSRKEVAATLDSEKGIATVPISQAASSTIAPIDKHRYTIGFDIYDLAGNKTSVSRQSNIQRSVPTNTVEIYNSSTSSWQTYVENMTVYSNPVKIRYGRNKSEHVNFNGTDFGWADSTYNEVTDNKIYYNVELPYPQLYSYFNFYTKSGMLRTNRYPSLIFSYAPGVLKAPTPLSLQHQRTTSDGWHGQSHSTNQALTYNRIKINAQPRPYRQKAWLSGIGHCYIEISETSCEMDVSISRSSGRGYAPYSYGASRADGSWSVHKSHFYTYWDFNPPQIDALSRNDENIEFVVTDNDTINNWQINMFQTYSFEAAAINVNGDEFPLTLKSYTTRSYNTKSGIFTLDSLDEGTYDIVFTTKDTYGNAATKTLSDKVIIDQTPPAIIVRVNDEAFVHGQTVKGLESLSIELNDPHNPEIKSIALKGGPASDAVLLEWSPTGERDTYQLEYPRIFPSLEDNQSYTVDIVATDDYNQSATLSLIFDYIPNNIIKVDSIKTLAVNKILRDSFNKPFIYISSTQLRTADGKLAVGSQEIYFSVRSDADLPVQVVDTLIQPGETKSLYVELQDGRFELPIVPGENGTEGLSNFLLEVPSLR